MSPIPKQPPRQTFEQVHGVGPLDGSEPLDANDGRRPTFKCIDLKTGAVVICDDQTFDPALYERLPEKKSGGTP